MFKLKKISVSGKTRQELRNNIIKNFLEEKPGCGKGDDCSKYIYEVESLESGNKVKLKRPANLNKGVDFTVHIENEKFRIKGPNKDRPSHNNIIDDLLEKQAKEPIEYNKVKVLINKIYKCEEISDNEYRSIKIECGHSLEGIIKSIKWLFIEQDVTYWNWSGRNMFYSALKSKKLC